MIPQIKTLKYAQPFRPFRVQLSSGDTFTVDTPDHIAFSEAGQGQIALLNDDRTFSVVSGPHVTRVGQWNDASSAGL